MFKYMQNAKQSFSLLSNFADDVFSINIEDKCINKCHNAKPIMQLVLLGKSFEESGNVVKILQRIKLH